MKHLLTLQDCTAADIAGLLDLAATIKATPADYANAMAGKVLLMHFEKPSLRTRVSFETGALRLGGHAIYYDARTSPMGAGKESVADTARVMGRYVDVIMARLFEHVHLLELAQHADVPVINGLTNDYHPCQILADLLTIREHKGTLDGLTLTYLGDANNNVTHSLMLGCQLAGITCRIGCPDHPDFLPDPNVLAAAPCLVTADPREAADGADIIYTDTWMSYHITEEKRDQRFAALRAFQVTNELMAVAAPDAVFMNCLPAQRGIEQTAAVIDGPQSIVFDQAENRMWAQNAVLITLLNDA